MADDAASLSMSWAAPPDERYDAQVDFAKSDGTLQRALQLSQDVAPVIDQIRGILEEQDLVKAERGNVVLGPWAKREKPTLRGGQSVFVDDYQVTLQGDYWERPGLLGFDSMRSMVEQTPILNGIVLTRIRQVNRFCRPQTNKTDTGFVIQHVDPTVELADDQQKSVKLLEKFIANCGWEGNPRRRKQLKRDTLPMFMAKSVRDTLCMDAAPIETEFKRDKGLGLDGFYALDGATVRLCTEHGYQGDDEIYALQVIQGTVRTLYSYDDLVYEVRNPRTDVTACGYGYSETEMLIRVVTYLLNTMTYNGSFFDKNSIPRGLLNLFGNYSQEDLASFKRYLNAMTRGVSNAHNLPVLVAKDKEAGAQFVEIGGQMSEMAFGKWLSFLTAISCAIYQIAPEEISMESFGVGSSSLSGDDTEEKLVSSKDKGLRPLLGFYENLLSDFIIQPFAEDYCLRFVGLDNDDEKQRFEMFKLVGKVNEGRTQIGLDPDDGPLGDAPLNQALLGAWQQETGVGVPPPEEEDFGDPDAAGGDAPGAPAPDTSGPGGRDAKTAPSAAPDDKEEPVAKALSSADFGLPPIYVIDA